jgi:MMPL family
MSASRPPASLGGDVRPQTAVIAACLAGCRPDRSGPLDRLPRLVVLDDQAGALERPQRLRHEERDARRAHSSRACGTAPAQGKALGGADTSFPLFVFVFLVALGIDYNIFLMTRVREEAIKHDARHGAIIGLAASKERVTALTGS